MKQLFANAFFSLISGIFLVAGVAGALWVGDALFSDKKPKFNYALAYEVVPKSAVLEHSLVPNVPNFTVRGTVQNVDSARWDFVDVFVDLFVDQTKIGQCTEYSDNRSLAPNEKTQFLVSCNQLSNVNLSPNIRYEVFAKRKSSRFSGP